MASDPKTIAFILDQASSAGDVTARSMFGEYGIYCGDRMVALVCDDQLFLKPTAGNRRLAPDAEEAPPYPGAKPCLMIDPDRWDDRERMADLFRTTAAELPAPKPKRRNPATR